MSKQKNSKLRFYRKQKGLTRPELSFHTGVSKSMIYYYENLEKQPSLSAGIKLSLYLDIPMEQLFEEYYEQAIESINDYTSDQAKQSDETRNNFERRSA